jgi:hypothetical protein
LGAIGGMGAPSRFLSTVIVSFSVERRRMSRTRSRSRGSWSRIGAIACPVLLGLCPSVWSGETVVLPFRGYAQEAEEWCWAATGQAVMEFLDPKLKGDLCQCRQAELRLAGLRCCALVNSCTPQQPLSSACRDPGWPEFGRHGFDFRTTCDPLPESQWDRCVGAQLTWEAIVGELASGRPVVRAYRPERQGSNAIGHVVAVFGYRTTTEVGRGKRWVLIFDPKRICRKSCEGADAPCCQGDGWWVDYDEYRAASSYSHWIDFFAIRRKSTVTFPEVSSRQPTR